MKTSDLCDACESAIACELRFASFGRRPRFTGSIRTVRYAGGLGALRDLANRDGSGQVLVIDGAGMLSGALFGDVLAGLALRNNWAGVVVNGLIRDSAELAAMDIGVKALGTLPKRARLDGASEMDVPVTFGGATFAPGLHLVADEDGVIVLPEGVAANAVKIADALAATAAYATASGAH